MPFDFSVTANNFPSPPNVARLREALRVIEGLPEDSLVHFSDWVHCIAGWCARDAYFKAQGFTMCTHVERAPWPVYQGHHGAGAVSTFFNISLDQFKEIFNPGSKSLFSAANRYWAIVHLRELIQHYEPLPVLKPARVTRVRVLENA
jgi:hypothetical protein